MNVLTFTVDASSLYVTEPAAVTGCCSSFLQFNPVFEER